MASVRLLFVLALGLLFLVDHPLVQIISRFFLLMVGLSALVGHRVRQRLSLQGEFPEYRLFAHERQEVVVRVKNPSRFALGLFGIKDETGGLHTPRGSAQSAWLGAREQFELRYPIWIERRGVYQLGPLVLTAMDPLGFFPWTREYALVRSVTVFPRIIPADITLTRGLLGNLNASPWVEHADPLETRSIRPWQEGDEIRSVSWRQSAKTGSLMVKEYPRAQNIPLLILLNLRVADYAAKRQQGHQERVIEIGTALLVEAVRRDYDCQLSIPGHINLSSGLKESGVTLGLQALATIDAQKVSADLPEELARLPVNQKPFLVVVSPPLRDDDLAALQRFALLCRRPSFIMLDEAVARPDREGLDQAKLRGFTLYRASEHGDNTGELHAT